MMLCACRLVWCSVGGFLKTFPPPVRVLDEFVYDAVQDRGEPFHLCSARSPTRRRRRRRRLGTPHVIYIYRVYSVLQRFCSRTPRESSINKLVCLYIYLYVITLCGHLYYAVYIARIILYYIIYYTYIIL